MCDSRALTPYESRITHASARQSSMKLFLLVSLLLLFLLGRPVQAQPNPDTWQIIPLGEAAPDGALPVNDMVLDTNENTLWIGTREGLWRYDGRVAEHWDSPHTTDVRALWIDAQNQLWVGTTRGLVVLGPERRWEQRLEPLPGLVDPVWALAPSARDGLWVGTDNGLLHVDNAAAGEAASSFMSAADLIDTAVISLWAAGPDEFWVGTRDQGLFHLSQSAGDALAQMTPASHDLPAWRINALWADEANGTVWVGTEAGLCLLSLDDLAAPCRTPAETPLQNQSITGLFPDRAAPGAVWVATFANDTGQGHLWHNDVFSQTLASIYEGRDIRALAQDSEGQLWLGATTGLWQRRAVKWRLLLGEQDGRAINVQAIAEDEAGRLWVGSTTGLWWREADGAWHTIPDLAGRPVTCLWPDRLDGSLWACLGGGSGGVANISPSGTVDVDMDDGRLAGLQINDIWQDSQARLWFATAGGLWQKSGATWQHYPYREGSDPGPANPFVSSLAGDGGGGFWAGTRGGLSHFDGSAWQANASVLCEAPPLVQALVWETAHDRLWVGTRTGLAQCHWADQTIVWTAEDNVIADDVRALSLQTAAGNTYLWIGTFDGLSRANISQPRIGRLPVVSFNAETGLPHNRVQALYTTQAGTVLLGTPIGLWAYEPGRLAPQVRLCYPDCTQPTYDSLRHPGQALEIAYNEQGSLTAVGGDLQTPPENLIYRFEIGAGTAVTETWSLDGLLPLSTERLPAGEEMRLRTWAYDRDFNASSQPADLNVIRQPTPWLLRPVFVLGLLSATLIAGAIVYRQTRKFRLYGYRDLEVIVSPAAAGTPYHRVQGKAGRGVDFEAEDRLDWTLLQEPLARIEANESDDALLRFVGRHLYDSLFSPEATGQLQKKLGLGSKGIRLRLRFNGLPQMAALPWEAMHGGEELGYLTTQSNVALVRDYSMPEAQLSPMERPLKLLLVCARPSDLPRIQDDEVATEFEAIQTFAQEETTDRIIVRVLNQATPEAFWEAINEEYDFIHFIGHGGLKEGQGVLYFEDVDGQSLAVNQTALASAFNQPSTFTNRTPKLLFLNACRTGEAGNRAGIKGLATTLVTEGRVPAVIGMGYPIASESAARFSQFFYQTLIRHGQVDYAVAEGRKSLFGLEGSDLRDWLTPRLYLSVEEGIVFDLT